MIDTALKAVADDLNSYLLGLSPSLQATSGRPPLAVLGPVADENGKASQNNNIVVSLVNLHQYKTGLSSTPLNSPVANGTEFMSQTRPIELFLHVMFSACFPDYVTGLKTLSETIAFLHAKRDFNKDNTTGLGDAVERLSFNMIDMDYDQLSHLWSILGAKYVPCAVYQARMLALPGVLLGQRHAIAQIGRQVTPK